MTTDKNPKTIPAYPVQEVYVTDLGRGPREFIKQHQGMTLRDHFASCAPITRDAAFEEAQRMCPGNRIITEQEIMQARARLSYQYADCMLEARKT